MAIHNYVLMMGYISITPMINEKEHKAYCTIATIRGDRYVGDGDGKEFIKKEKIILFTTDPDMVAEMNKWKKYNIVEVEGTIATRRIHGNVKCDHCDNVEPYDYELVYMNPIFAKKREDTITKEAAFDVLKNDKEISNKVFLIGRLCKDPKMISTKAGIVITKYPLAVNRKYRHKEDDIDERTDYPWITSYGKNATEDMKRIHMNTLVYIDGFIQSRHIIRTKKCSKCNEFFHWQDITIEAIPYETEYLEDFNSDKILEEISKMEMDKINNRTKKPEEIESEKEQEEIKEKEKEKLSKDIYKFEGYNDEIILSEEDKKKFETNCYEDDEDD